MTSFPQQFSADQIEMFVLDVVRHDATDLDRIMDLLNDHHTFGWRDVLKRRFDRDEVVRAVVSLVDRAWLTPLEYDPDLRELKASQARPIDPEELWFVLSAAGRVAWDVWVPPKP